jgi:hypothetical protein
MIRQEIVQALRCCAEGDCKGCAMHEDKQRCQENLLAKAAETIERLTAENAALREKVPQWIRCKDELPQPEQAILTRDKWGHIRDRVFHKFLSGPVLFRPDGLAPIKDVTHWMPLPEAPEEGGKHE